LFSPADLIICCVQLKCLAGRTRIHPPPHLNLQKMV